MKQKMFLFMVAGPVQCELCVTPGKLMIHAVSVAELELGQEGGAAPATTFLKTVSFSFLFLSFFHIHSSRTHRHRGRTTQSVSLKNVFPISAFYFLFSFSFLPTCGENTPSPYTISCHVRFPVVYSIFVASRSPVLKPFFFLHPKSQLKVSVIIKIKG